MCTLTVFAHGSSTVVTMNRDEADTRDEAGEFLQNNANPRQHYWWPLDSVSHGTWLGVRGDGLVIALLNRYQAQGNPPQRSRGLIIPELLRSLETSLTVEDAISRRRLPCRRTISPEKLTEKNWQDFAPFDLVVVLGNQLWQCSWEKDEMQVQHVELNSPYLLVSSSVDYEDSVRVRRKAFERFAQDYAQASPEEIIEKLHRQPYVENLSLGIQMKRPGRCTRSISQAVIAEAGTPITRYLPL